MKISVVVPFYKHPELAESFLRQFFDHTDFLKYEVELFAVDDCSQSKELTEVLERWKEKYPLIMTVIAREENGGFPGATNSGMKASSGEYVICISSDVNVLDLKWIDSLVEPQKEKKCITGGQYIDFNTITFVDSKIIPYIGGWCVCFSRQCLTELEEVIGSTDYFEPSFKPGYFEDVLISFYANYILGYELVAPGHTQPAMDVHLTHIGGQTLNQSLVDTNIVAERNRLVFGDKVRLACMKYGKTL